MRNIIIRKRCKGASNFYLILSFEKVFNCEISIFVSFGREVSSLVRNYNSSIRNPFPCIISMTFPEIGIRSSAQSSLILKRRAMIEMRSKTIEPKKALLRFLSTILTFLKLILQNLYIKLSHYFQTHPPFPF